jgi:hypothetical protein
MLTAADVALPWVYSPWLVEVDGGYPLLSTLAELLSHPSDPDGVATTP